MQYHELEVSRLEWLTRHVWLWQDLPESFREMNPNYWERQREIVTTMQKEGLYSPATHWRDVNLLRLLGIVRSNPFSIPGDKS
jgi:hypothetical protein